MSKGYIQTSMTQVDYSGENGCSPTPSGNVVTDGKTSTQGLPARTGGKIPEVTYDTNVALPGRLSSSK